MSHGEKEDISIKKDEGIVQTEKNEERNCECETTDTNIFGVWLPEINQSDQAADAVM